MVTIAELQFRACGIRWSPVDLDAMTSSSVDRVRRRFQSLFPEVIWDTAALEGNNFTLPEVRTLLDGVVVPGRTLHDQQQILSLATAYAKLDELVRHESFSLTKMVSDQLHGILAEHEALDPGFFRGEGEAQGGGAVRLARGGTVAGTPHGVGGSALRQHYDDLLGFLATINDPRERALVYFASATRRQFYFDGNKRTARLMMAGELLTHGFDAISIPFSRRLEFNTILDDLFVTDDATELLRFLASCTLD